MRSGALVASLLVVAAAFAACGSDGKLSVEDGLRLMVLQPEDLGNGFELASEALTDNEESAAGDGELAAKLDEWGRILGYDISYDPADGADTPVRGVNVSASLYEGEEGAKDSFDDAVATAEATDWAARYAGLREFQVDRFETDTEADEAVWIRLSGVQPGAGGADELVTDDLIFFREGRERGFLRVQTASSEVTDRTFYRDEIEGWLGTLIGNVEDTLPDVEGSN